MSERSCNDHVGREEWRLLRTPPLPGALNMAIDEVLLEAVASGRSRPVFRLYGWAPPAITIGYAQPLADVDREACRRRGYDIVRRPTGGRAVLHDNECTYAVVARTGGIFPATIAASYRMIAEVLRSALLALGIDAEFVESRRRETQPGICFTAPAYGELLCSGCKITGSAQKRRGSAFLQHGSIPVELDLRQYIELLGAGSPPSAAAEELARSIGWLNRFSRSPLSIAEVEAALVAAIAAGLPVRLLDDQLTGAEWDAATRLAAGKRAP